MTINISEFLYLTLQDHFPLVLCSVLLHFYGCMFFFPLSHSFSPHISCYSALSSTRRGKYANLYIKEKSVPTKLNKVQYKICMQCKSIKVLFSQLNNTFYVLIHTDIEITHCAVSQFDSSVHINLYILVKFYTKSVLKSYASSLLCCTEVRSMLTGTNFTFLVGLATEDKRQNNLDCQKTVT